MQDRKLAAALCHLSQYGVPVNTHIAAPARWKRGERDEREGRGKEKAPIPTPSALAFCKHKISSHHSKGKWPQEKPRGNSQDQAGAGTMIAPAGESAGGTTHHFSGTGATGVAGLLGNARP